jgi:hypothetical protein
MSRCTIRSSGMPARCTPCHTCLWANKCLISTARGGDYLWKCPDSQNPFRSNYTLHTSEQRLGETPVGGACQPERSLLCTAGGLPAETPILPKMAVFAVCSQCSC